MFVVNPILACDFYKVGHKFQYPKGTQEIYSNFTPRSNSRAPAGITKIVSAGYQGFIKSFLLDSFNRFFFSLPKEVVMEEYDRRTNGALGPNSVDSSHIAALHDLGYLPIEIKALPEGSRSSMQVPVLTIRNTLPEFFWLTNYLETALSSDLWKKITVATIAFEYRKILTQYAKDTGSPLDFVLWQGHDFSMRGMSSTQEAGESGAFHLFSFLGTDTIPAIEYLEWYYGGENTFVGGSVPATEHSVMCAGGMDNEVETIRRLIQDVYPNGVVSVVSDTWDFWDTISVKARELKDVIMHRKPNELGLAKTVFRPDSGDPVRVICGIEYFDLDGDPEACYMDIHDSGLNVVKTNNKYYNVCFSYDKYDGYIDGYTLEEEIPEIEVKGSIEVLWDIFGGTVTDKGYKLLDSHVGLIYGDSITLDRAKAILEGMKKKGFASGNVVFGIGSFTYQYLTRDTFGFAMKATNAVIDGTSVPIFKAPKTDSGKKSALGYLRVDKENDEFVLKQNVSPDREGGELRTIFKDGVLTVDENLDTIRARIQAEIDKETS